MYFIGILYTIYIYRYLDMISNIMNKTDVNFSKDYVIHIFDYIELSFIDGLW